MVGRLAEILDECEQAAVLTAWAMRDGKALARVFDRIHLDHQAWGSGKRYARRCDVPAWSGICQHECKACG